MIYINRLSTLPEIRAAWSLNPKLNALWLSEDQSQNVHSIMVSGPTSLDSTPDFTTKTSKGVEKHTNRHGIADIQK